MKFSRALPISIASAALMAAAGFAATPLAVAPDFVLKSVAGSNIRLSEYRGEVVMLAFWATWCGDCRAQLSHLAETHGRYADAGVALLAVSLDQDRHDAGEVAEAMSVSYPVLHDAGGEVGRLYEVDSVPMLMVIDREGVVREVFEGYRRGDEQQYLERVQELLREY
jgi:peroxiredoxin